MADKQIGILIGSLRRESYCRAIANYIMSVAPTGLSIKEIPLGELSMFNQDYDDDGTTPTAWKVFREEIRQLDGVLFITPEYNRSMPAVLKNALDIASRPYGQSVWAGKAGGIISVSPGHVGGFGANQHLRQPMGFLDIRLMQQPEAYVCDVTTALDDKNNVVKESTQQSLQNYLQAFKKWVTIIEG